MHAHCPNDPTHKTFITSASETHDWLVDERGEFVEDKGCSQVLHKPTVDNLWECATCGADAIVANY